MPHNRLRLIIFVPLLALLLLLPLFSVAAPSQEADTEVHPAKTMTFTPESAAATAERLRKEQESSEYQTAWNHINHSRYEQAVEILRPMAEAGNSMAMFWMGECLWKIHGGLGLNSRFRGIPNEKAQEFFWKSANEGNFYAMFILGDHLHEFEVLQNCEKYCLLRAKENDPEAFFVLYRLGMILRKNADPDLIVRGALLGSDVAVLFMTGYDADDNASYVSEALNQEVPDWRERILIPLKAMADAGNPKAQFNYSLQTEKVPPYSTVKPSEYNATYPYMEKAFENRFARAAFALASRYGSNAPTPDNVRRFIFCDTVNYIDRNLPENIPTLSYLNWIFYSRKKTVPVTQKEYEAEVELAKKWRDARPDVCIYRHPLWDGR